MKRLFRKIRRAFKKLPGRVFGFLGLDPAKWVARFRGRFGYRRLRRKTKRWLARRQWRLFKFCLPAMLAGFIFAVVVAMIVFVLERRVELRHHYHKVATASLAAGNFEMARVASLRGLAGAQNDRDRLEWLFYLAVAMNGLGHQQEAADLLAVAAPLDHPGSVPAHLLAAQTFLNTTNVTSDALLKAEKHLRYAIAIDPKSAEANELLGRLYINTHQLDKARKCLMTIYAAKPGSALLLAVCYDLEKDGGAAVLWADRAITAIRDQLIYTAPNASPADRLGLIRALLIKAKYAPLLDPLEKAMLTGTNAMPQDSPPVWLDLVRDLKRAEKYEPALKTLERATRVSPSPIYPPAIADICATWAEKIPANQNAERLQLIQKGLENAALNLKLCWLLIQATHVPEQSGADAKKLLDESVAAATGPAAAWWYFLLWTDARMRGDLPTARSYLKTAYNLAPQIPQIQNDFAMDQATTGSREDLERGLALINQVIEKFPNNPGFRDTRGRILAKLGQNEAAAADLQFVINRMPNATGTRLVLTKVYEALGKNQFTATNYTGTTLRQMRVWLNQGNFMRALETVEQANRAQPNPAYPPAIAETCLAWAEKMLPGQEPEKLRLVTEGLKYDPQSQKLRMLLLQATHASDNSAVSAKKSLEQLVAVAKGESAAEWHLLLGQDALARGNAAVARQHLETAYKLSPQITQVQASLALALAGGNPDDLTRALALIQPVVDEFSEMPEFRNTRGLILARLGRNQEAVVDLKFAVGKLPEPKSSRLLLAKVYDALGKTQLADQQRRLAEAAGKVK